MKLAVRSVLIGTVIWLASSLFAQVPHLTPFSADMQMSSSQANPVNRDMSGKIYVSPQAMRMDMQGEHEANIITTFPTQTVDIILSIKVNNNQASLLSSLCSNTRYQWLTRSLWGYEKSTGLLFSVLSVVLIMVLNNTCISFHKSYSASDICVA